MSGLALSMALDGGQAVSQYLDWPFDGFFTLDGETYGVSETGLYRIGGQAADTPSLSLIRLPATDGGRPGESRLECVEIGGRLPEGLTMRVWYDGILKGTYEAPNSQAGQHTIYVGRNCCGRYLELEFVAHGEHFEIMSIMAECQELGRRRGRR